MFDTLSCMRMLVLLCVGLCALPEIAARDEDNATSVDLFETDPATPSENELALRPLENTVRNLQFLANGGAILIMNGHRPPEGQPFALLSLANPDAEYVLFVESRESIKKDFLISARIRHPLLELDVGRRWLPGPRTNILSDPLARSSFARPPVAAVDGEGSLLEIPDGRRFPVLFARVPLTAWLPGFFHVRGDPDPDNGFYFASRRLLIAAGERRGAFVVHGPLSLPDTERFAYASLDLERSREFRAPIRPDATAPSQAAGSAQSYTTHSGTARLSIDRRPRIVLATFEAERRARWDYADYEHHRLEPERAGRSGQAATVVRAFDLLEVEAAGQDRGRDGFRMGGAALVPVWPGFASVPQATAFPERSGRVLFRARAYRRARYGAMVAAGGPSMSGRRLPRREFSAGGLGYRLQSPGAVFEIYGEARRHGGRSLELRVELGRHQSAHAAPDTAAANLMAGTNREASASGWRFSASLIYGRLSGGKDEFLFLRNAPDDRGARARFFGQEQGALILRLRSEFVALYLESRLDSHTGRTTNLANFQFRLMF